MVKGRAVYVVLTDGAVFEFRNDKLYIWESEDDIPAAADPINVYDLEAMYSVPQ